VVKPLPRPAGARRFRGVALRFPARLAPPATRGASFGSSFSWFRRQESPPIISPTPSALYFALPFCKLFGPSGVPAEDSLHVVGVLWVHTICPERHAPPRLPSPESPSPHHYFAQLSRWSFRPRARCASDDCCREAPPPVNSPVSCWHSFFQLVLVFSEPNVQKLLVVLQQRQINKTLLSGSNKHFR